MKTPRIRTSALALLVPLVAAQSGCYSVYQPATSPRIERRSDGVLLKNGKKVESLAEAVRENPAAAAEVEQGDRASATGTVVYVSGLAGTMAAGIAGGALSYGQKSLSPASIAILVAGGAVWVGSSILGIAYWAKGARHEVNAINRYNDGIEPCSPPKKAARTVVIVR